LEAGREDIDIAASLDPHNSLARSYLGKVYYEEKRDKQAGDQFAIAKELDPKDPTPWFYDAIRKQSINTQMVVKPIISNISSHACTCYDEYGCVGHCKDN
jgi:hypothetical protein